MDNVLRNFTTQTAKTVEPVTIDAWWETHPLWVVYPVVSQYVLWFQFLAGTILNPLSALVFTRCNFKTSSVSQYLCAVSLCDFIFCLTGLGANIFVRIVIRAPREYSRDFGIRTNTGIRAISRHFYIILKGGVLENLLGDYGVISMNNAL